MIRQRRRKKGSSAAAWREVERERERDAAWLKVKAPQFFRLVGCGASSGINIIASRSVKNCLRSTRGNPFSVSWASLNRSDRLCGGFQYQRGESLVDRVPR